MPIVPPTLDKTTRDALTDYLRRGGKWRKAGAIPEAVLAALFAALSQFLPGFLQAIIDGWLKKNPKPEPGPAPARFGAGVDEDEDEDEMIDEEDDALAPLVGTLVALAEAEAACREDEGRMTGPIFDARAAEVLTAIEGYAGRLYEQFGHAAVLHALSLVGDRLPFGAASPADEDEAA